MTNTQYIVGWTVYVIGSCGCLAALLPITKKLPVRARRALISSAVAVLLTPWWLNDDSSTLTPAFFTALYDTLTFGPQEIIRSGMIVMVVVTLCITFSFVIPAGKKNPPDVS